MKQIRLPRWGKAILIIALVILLAAALAKPAEKLFLSIILPGQWELWQAAVRTGMISGRTARSPCGAMSPRAKAPGV